MKVCIYGRVSTGEQDADNQIMVLTTWADQRGYEVVKVYQEDESAWKSGHGLWIVLVGKVPWQY